MLTPADLAAIRARADAATPGPWDFDTVDVPDVYFSDGNERHGYRSYTVYEDKPDGKTIVDATNSDGGTIEEEYDADGVDAWDETARRNAAFIAGSRQDIPAMLAHIDALTARVAELERENEQLATAYRNL